LSNDSNQCGADAWKPNANPSSKTNSSSTTSSTNTNFNSNNTKLVGDWGTKRLNIQPDPQFNEKRLAAEKLEEERRISDDLRRRQELKIQAQQQRGREKVENSLWRTTTDSSASFRQNGGLLRRLMQMADVWSLLSSRFLSVLEGIAVVRTCSEFRAIAATYRASIFFHVPKPVIGGTRTVHYEFESARYGRAGPLRLPICDYF
jgi:hypothetical protein